MAKPSSTITVTGTNGDDILHIPAGYDITQVSVNGRGGTDTLDLSNYQAPNGSSGVYLSETGTTSQPDSAVSDWSFVGVPGSSSSYGHLVFGTIQSIENLTGSSGNDWLMMGVGGIPTTLNGGPGNDYLSASNAASATLIGGSGSDWIYSVVPNSTLIGGSLVNGVVHEDPAGTSVDTFEIGPVNVNILDFQVGTDRLLFDATATHPAFTGGIWVDNGSGGSTLMVIGAARVTLDGISPSTAQQSVAFGFEYTSTANGIFQGGPTNDVLYCNPNYAETVVTGPGTGNDVVMNFDKTHDVLDFASDTQVTWSNTYVNGQESLLGMFGGGSVTLTGLTTNDLSSGALHVQGLITPATIDPTDHMSWWSVPSDAALI